MRHLIKPMPLILIYVVKYEQAPETRHSQIGPARWYHPVKSITNDEQLLLYGPSGYFILLSTA